MINSEVDRETLHSFLNHVLVENLKSPDSKVIAIEQCKILKNELDKAKPIASKKSRVSDSSDYKRIDKINNLIEAVFRINIELCEYEEAIRYFNKNYVERDKETILYVLLSLLLDYKLKEYWLREYDEAVKKGIQPRQVLKNARKYIKENEEMPEYFHYC